jgi:hypothetical protein
MQKLNLLEMEKKDDNDIVPSCDSLFKIVRDAKQSDCDITMFFVRA